MEILWLDNRFLILCFVVFNVNFILVYIILHLVSRTQLRHMRHISELLTQTRGEILRIAAQTSADVTEIHKDVFRRKRRRMRNPNHVEI